MIICVPDDVDWDDPDWHLAYSDAELVEMQMTGGAERGYAELVVEVLRGRYTGPLLE